MKRIIKWFKENVYFVLYRLDKDNYTSITPCIGYLYDNGIRSYKSTDVGGVLVNAKQLTIAFEWFRYTIDIHIFWDNKTEIITN